MQQLSGDYITRCGSLSEAQSQQDTVISTVQQMAASTIEERREPPTPFGSTSPIVVDSPESSEHSRSKGCLSAEVDGGWAWMVTFTSFLIIMFVDGISFTYGVISEELIEYFHLEENVAKGSIPGAVLQGFYLIAGPLGSVLLARLGYRIVAMTGSLLAIVGFLSASFAPNIELLTFTYGAIAGLGFSFLFLTSMVATTVYFDRWRALAVGLASCGSGLGIFIYPLMARHILDLLNWQWCLRIQAAMLVLCLLISLTFRPPNTEVKVEKPTMREAFLSSFKLSLLKNPIFILVLIMAFSSTIGILIPFNYIPLTGVERNLTETQSAWLVSIMGATNTAGRLIVGAAAFKAPFHPLVFMIVGHSMGALATFLSVWCNSFTLLAVYCGFFGLVFAIDAVLSTVILAKILGEDNLSGSFGIFCLIRGITGITVTPVAGILYDTSGNYRATFYLSASALLLTAILSAISLILARKQQSRSSYDMDNPDIVCHIKNSDVQFTKKNGLK